MNSCGLGPCDKSRERGGAGCDLCDRVAKLAQPKEERGELLKKKPPKKRKDA